MPQYVAIFEKFCGTLSCSFKDFICVTENGILPTYHRQPIILSNRLIARIIEKRLKQQTADDRYKVVEYGPDFLTHEVHPFWTLSPLSEWQKDSSSDKTLPLADAIMKQKEGQK